MLPNSMEPAAAFFQSKGNTSPKEVNVHLAPGFKLKRLAVEHAIDLMVARHEALHSTAGVHLSKADIHLFMDDESADDEEDSCRITMVQLLNSTEASHLAGAVVAVAVVATTAAAAAAAIHALL